MTCSRPSNNKHKIYAKNGLAKRPKSVRVRRPREIADRIALPAPAAALLPERATSKTIDRLLLSKKNPAAVLVDEGLELLEVRGDAAAFIRLPEGRASLHLLNLILDTGLFLEIEKLIQQSQESEQAASRALVPYDSGDGIREVNIEATPLQDRRGRLFLVLLEKRVEEGAEAPERQSAIGDAALPQDRLVAKLKQEVAETRRRLISIFEEHQKADEASQSSTEEAQSTNEELQSLNEEMETAKGRKSAA